MKFSVLLPTRNRLDLLGYAVESVLKQDYNDWEIIISDNASEEDISGYIRALNEPRIKYFRTESFIPVTDNWNNALEKCSGDYILMLGDDDCIMNGYFTFMHKLINIYSLPDTIYTGAFLFAYPRVMPDFPNGILQTYCKAPFFRGQREPFFLDKNQALRLVRQSMNFNMMFTYNMQHSIVKKEFIYALMNKGKFFQSPYPDFYATNVIFLVADRILICPKPMVTIGISPKSFGYFYFNDKEKDGMEFLKNQTNADSTKRLKDVILPGSIDRTSWLVAMETIRMNFGTDYCLRINYRRYRFLQTMHLLAAYYRVKSISKSDMITLWKRLNFMEKIIYGYSMRFIYIAASLIPSKMRNKINACVAKYIIKTPRLESKENICKYNTILDVFYNIDPLNYRI